MPYLPFFHGYASNPQTLICDGSQRSFLGPLVFLLNASPLSKYISLPSLDHDLYPGDTQLFISFTPHSLQDAPNDILCNTIPIRVSAWMNISPLCLNSPKTQFHRPYLPNLRTSFQQISLLPCLTRLQLAIV